MTNRTLQLLNQSNDIVSIKQVDDKYLQVFGHLDNNDSFRFATKTDAMHMLEFCEAFIRRDDILRFNQGASD